MTKKTYLIFISAAILILPVIALAQKQCSPGYSGTELCNALPVSNIRELFEMAFGALASVIGTLALVMIIFGGARMVFSQGDQQAVTQGKASITYAIYGLLLTMFAYVIVSGVQYFIGFNENSIQPGQSPGGGFLASLNQPNLMSFVLNAMRNFLGLIGTAAMLYIIISGFRYVTSGGNEEQAKKARAALTWAILGLVSVIVSYLIVTVVINAVFRAAA
jgi:hypothetical protein